jgi:flagellar protein FlgJ
MITDRTPLEHAGPQARELEQRRTQTPEEAARQFEEILVRQFVGELTKGLFEQGLSGDDGPGWIQSQSQIQRDALNDTLTKYFVDSGTLKLSDHLLRQWNRQEAPSELLDTPASPPEDERLT